MLYGPASLALAPCPPLSLSMDVMSCIDNALTGAAIINKLIFDPIFVPCRYADRTSIFSVMVRIIIVSG